MKTYSSKLMTTIINSDDGTHNYEVTRTLEDVEGDKAIVLMLYPSFSGQDLFQMDSTAMHMTNHLMNDLQISSVKVINLFSKIVKGSKMSCRDAVVEWRRMYRCVATISPADRSNDCSSPGLWLPIRTF